MNTNNRAKIILNPAIATHFIHYRDYALGADGTEYVLPNGGTTFAWAESISGNLIVAKASCHPKDQFRKAVARAKAAGRLNSFRHATIVPGVKDFFKQPRDQQLKYLEENVFFRKDEDVVRDHAVRENLVIPTAAVAATGCCNDNLCGC